MTVAAIAETMETTSKEMKNLFLLLLVLTWVGLLHAQPDRSKEKIAVIVGDPTSAHSVALLQSLENKKFRFKLYSLKQLSTIPYQEIFDQFLHSAVVRLIDQKDSSSLMTLEESDFWTEFLSNRGSLTLFADTLSNQAAVFTSEFTGYVGFKVRKLNAQIGRVNGEQKDLIAKGTSFDIDKNKARDQIVPQTGSTIEVVYTSPEGVIAGLKQQTCNFRMSYFTFLPGEIKSLKVRNEFVERAVDWNLGYSIALGMNAPDFNIRLADGTPTGMYNEYNKLNSVVVLEFMATWCSYCEKQLPRMVTLRQEFRDANVSFIFVDYKEKLSTVQAYLREHPEIDWPVVITPDGLGALHYGVKSLPGIFILDEERRIRFMHQGNVSISDLKKVISETLRSSSFNRIYN